VLMPNHGGLPRIHRVEPAGCRYWSVADSAELSAATVGFGATTHIKDARGTVGRQLVNPGPHRPEPCPRRVLTVSWRLLLGRLNSNGVAFVAFVAFGDLLEPSVSGNG
jgi:hypothetical protein